MNYERSVSIQFFFETMIFENKTCHTLQNTDALQRRELEGYHRYRNEIKMIEKVFLAIKRDIDAAIEPFTRIEHNLANRGLENEPDLPNIDLENTNIL